MHDTLLSEFLSRRNDMLLFVIVPSMTPFELKPIIYQFTALLMT